MEGVKANERNTMRSCGDGPLVRNLVGAAVLVVSCTRKMYPKCDPSILKTRDQEVGVGAIPIDSLTCRRMQRHDATRFDLLVIVDVPNHHIPIQPCCRYSVH